LGHRIGMVLLRDLALDTKMETSCRWTSRANRNLEKLDHLERALDDMHVIIESSNVLSTFLSGRLDAVPACLASSSTQCLPSRSSPECDIAVDETPFPKCCHPYYTRRSATPAQRTFGRPSTLHACVQPSLPAPPSKHLHLHPASHNPSHLSPKPLPSHTAMLCAFPSPCKK